MPTYITLMKLTDQGTRDIKNAPGRTDQGIKGIEERGGKVLGFYTVMGEYDYIVVTEYPSDEQAMETSLRISAAGNVKTTTLKAFTKDEFAQIVKNLP